MHDVLHTCLDFEDMHVSEIVLAGHRKRPVSQHAEPPPLHADMLSVHASWFTQPLRGL